MRHMVFERRLDNFEIVFCYSKTEGIFLGFIKMFHFYYSFLILKNVRSERLGNRQNIGCEPMKSFLNFNYLLPSAGAKLAETRGLGMGE